MDRFQGTEIAPNTFVGTHYFFFSTVYTMAAVPPPHAHQHRRARSIGSSVLSVQLLQSASITTAGETNGAATAATETMLSVLISAYQVRWNAVEERLATHPQETAVVDASGHSVLYRALARRIEDYPPVRIVRKILRAYPIATWERHDQTTLLELACWRRASLETLETLTESRPSIPEDATALSALWKSYCIVHGNEAAFVQFLQLATSEEKLVDDDDDSGGNDESHNSDNNSEAFEVGCKFQLLLRYLTTEQMLPCTIQTALFSSECSLELFKFFFDVLPSLSSKSTENPLEMDPTRFDRGDALLLRKLEYFQQQYRVRPQPTMVLIDRSGRPSANAGGGGGLGTEVQGATEVVWISPALEAMVERLGKTNDEDDLYTQFIATIRKPVDPKWHQLIGAAQVLQCPPKLMRLLITMHPEKLLHADCRGWLPLHHAVAGPSRGAGGEDQQEDEIISMILVACPQACTQRDKYGRLPFHLACLSGKGVWLLKKLEQHYPKAVQDVDVVLGLPPVFLAAQSDRAGLSNVYHLLNSAPGVILDAQSAGTNGSLKTDS